MMTLEQPAVTQIREATVDDLPQIVSLLGQFAQEADFPVKYKPEVITDSWTKFIVSGIGAIIGAWQGDECIGVLGAIKHPDVNDGELTAMELFWFVTKEHRHSMTGMRLLKAYEQWAVDGGCTRIGIGHLEKLSPERLHRLFVSRGYTQMETFYRKEVSNELS